MELTTTAVAAGGDAIGRDSTGRVVFVDGALPGERVRVAVVEERRDFARAMTVEVLEAAPGRVAPPCPHVGDGCGGCSWQHAAPDTQLELKRAIVEDSLRRIGRLADQPPVEFGPELPAVGFRTTVRAAVVNGRAGFRHRRSHDVVTVDHCLVAHPLIDEILHEGRFGEATEVTVRAGAATGERLVIARPTAAGVSVPPDAVVVGRDELRNGRRAWIHEEVAGHRFRISANSFFQPRPDGASALAALVVAAVAGSDPGRVVDLYGGVGVFAFVVAGVAHGPVVVVERAASAVSDARHNLAGLQAKVLAVDVERWHPSPAAVVVADPPRSGLGRRAVARVAATAAQRVVLVSCDPAAFARDAGLLAGHGYRLVGLTLVDMFPHTAHVEVVSRFEPEVRR